MRWITFMLGFISVVPMIYMGIFMISLQLGASYKEATLASKIILFGSPFIIFPLYYKFREEKKEVIAACSCLCICVTLFIASIITCVVIGFNKHPNSHS